MSEPHTSWAWPQPGNGERQRKVKMCTSTNSKVKHNKLITNLATNSHWPIKDPMHAQNGWLWWVDDGGAEERAKNSTITDSERATIHILHCQLILTGLWAKIYIKKWWNIRNLKLRFGTLKGKALSHQRINHFFSHLNHLLNSKYK